MTPEGFFELGYIKGATGLEGGLKVQLDADDPSRYEALDTIFLLIGQQAVPYEVEGLELKGDEALVFLVPIQTREAAEALKSTTLLLPDAFLEAVPESGFYYHELVGCTLQDLESGWQGAVARWYEMPQQILLGVEAAGAEVMVPLNEATLVAFERENQLVKVRLPEGLIDLYKNEVQW